MCLLTFMIRFHVFVHFQRLLLDVYHDFIWWKCELFQTTMKSSTHWNSYQNLGHQDQTAVILNEMPRICDVISSIIHEHSPNPGPVPVQCVCRLQETISVLYVSGDDSVNNRSVRDSIHASPSLHTWSKVSEMCPRPIRIMTACPGQSKQCQR